MLQQHIYWNWANTENINFSPVQWWHAHLWCIPYFKKFFLEDLVNWLLDLHVSAFYHQCLGGMAYWNLWKALRNSSGCSLFCFFQNSHANNTRLSKKALFLKSDHSVTKGMYVAKLDLVGPAVYHWFHNSAENHIKNYFSSYCIGYHISQDQSSQPA